MLNMPLSISTAFLLAAPIQAQSAKLLEIWTGSWSSNAHIDGLCQIGDRASITLTLQSAGKNKIKEIFVETTPDLDFENIRYDSMDIKLADAGKKIGSNKVVAPAGQYETALYRLSIKNMKDAKGMFSLNFTFSGKPTGHQNALVLLNMAKSLPLTGQRFEVPKNGRTECKAI